MSKVAMEKALDALKEWKEEAPYAWSKADDEAIEELEKALLVSNFWGGVDFDIKTNLHGHKWTDLTAEELKKIWYEIQTIIGWYSFLEIAVAIEKSLKEKNHV